MCNAGWKAEIARGEAECYFSFPACITSAINPKIPHQTMLSQTNSILLHSSLIMKYLLKGIYIDDTACMSVNTIIMTLVLFILVLNPGPFLARLHSFMHLHCGVRRETVACTHVHSTVVKNKLRGTLTDG